MTPSVTAPVDEKPAVTWAFQPSLPEGIDALTTLSEPFPPPV